MTTELSSATSTDSNQNRSDIRHSTGQEWRCDCGRLLFKGAFLVGIIEVKCARCKRIVYLQEFDTFTTGEESCMMTVDLDGNILSANFGVSTILGYPPEQIIGSNLDILVDESIKPVVKFWIDQIRELRQAENPYVVAVIEALTSKGEKVNLSFMAKCIELDGRLVILAIAEVGENVVDRYEKKIRSKLNPKDDARPFVQAREQREPWDFIVDHEGNILYLSGTTLLGYTQDDLVGQPIFSIVDPSISKNDQQKLLSQISQDKSFISKLKLADKSSDIISAELCFTTDFLAKEGEEGFIVVVKTS